MNALPSRTTLDQKELEDIVLLILDEAKKQGADQVEAAASHDIGLCATARLGDVESLEYTNDRGVGITVYKDHKKGSASTSDFSPAALREAVSKACTFANFTASDEHAGLADAELMAQEPPDLDLAHDWNLQSDVAIRHAIECEDAARSFDKRITNSEGATVNTSGGVRVYANSHGFLGGFPKTSHSISCVVIGEADGVMERDYWYSAARDAADLETPAAIGRMAAERTVQRLGGRKVKTGNSPVLFAPEVARGFVGHAIGAIAGGAQYRRASFLLDAAGEQIFPDFMQIQERPHIPKGMSSAPYDAEGVATSDRDIIRDGVLTGYVLDSYSARRLGLETTGNAGGVHNLVVQPGRFSGRELMQQMGTGLLVTEVMGQGVSIVTGDYSRGAAGFWVENGEIQFPVDEVTIAGHLKDMFSAIEAVGTDVDDRSGIQSGSILMGKMTVAGS